MKVEAKLKEMGIELPWPVTPEANYIKAVRTNNLIFLAGHDPRRPDGTLITGKLGQDLNLEDGYEAARWGGVQSTSYSQAGALRTESTRASTSAGQLIQIDIGLFTNWVNAYANDQQNLVDFYQDRFRSEFLPAFDAWLDTDPANNPDSPKSPFAMPEYNLPEMEESQQLLEQAEQKFKEGQEANQTSDNYVFMTIIFASVLFLGGIQSRFKSITLRLIIILLSLLILVYGLYNLITYPII